MDQNSSDHGHCTCIKAKFCQILMWVACDFKWVTAKPQVKTCLNVWTLFDRRRRLSVKRISQSVHKHRTNFIFSFSCVFFRSTGTKHLFWSWKPFFRNLEYLFFPDDDEKVTIITIPVTEEGQGEEEVYNAVMNVEEFLAEHNIRHVFIDNDDVNSS